MEDVGGRASVAPYWRKDNSKVSNNRLKKKKEKKTKVFEMKWKVQVLEFFLPASDRK